MFDFAKLKTPPNHGDILIVPDPVDFRVALEANTASLERADRTILGLPLCEWRRRTRQRIVGRQDAPVIVTGHQPAFVHAGVWAKHVVATRCAAALGGSAINLVVDNDAPKSSAVVIPTVIDGAVVLRSIRYATMPVGCAYEQIPRLDETRIARFESEIADAMAERFAGSLMPTFFDGVRAATPDGDWVDQAVSGRRAVEASLDVRIDDRRVSNVWCSPLLLDMIVNAEPFATSYNAALAAYRRDQKVRDPRRPMPDLSRTDGRCEVPVWVYRKTEPRGRLFVRRRNDSVELFAGDRLFAKVAVADLRCCDQAKPILAGLEEWRFRPRALTLTIWARLLLADLFVHGIGGAKYDRISDRIINDYYGVEPPHMACVSATVLLDLPMQGVSADSVRQARRRLRDFTYNPQRHLELQGDLGALARGRAEAVRNSEQLRAADSHDRVARRAAFRKIREITAEMVSRDERYLAECQSAVDQEADRLRADRVAVGREYFFALSGLDRLSRLLDALPGSTEFARI